MDIPVQKTVTSSDIISVKINSKEYMYTKDMLLNLGYFLGYFNMHPDHTIINIPNRDNKTFKSIMNVIVYSIECSNLKELKYDGMIAADVLYYGVDTKMTKMLFFNVTSYMSATLYANFEDYCVSSSIGIYDERDEKKCVKKVVSVLDRKYYLRHYVLNPNKINEVLNMCTQYKEHDQDWYKTHSPSLQLRCYGNNVLEASYTCTYPLV
jgi:hypothetical protein